MKYRLDIAVPANGCFRKAQVRVLDDQGSILTTDDASMAGIKGREDLVKRLAKRLQLPVAGLRQEVESAWIEAVNKHERHADSSPAVAQESVEVRDRAPERISRPLCLIGRHAYAAAWPHLRVTIRQSVDDPPRFGTCQVPIVVRDDGLLFGPAGRGLSNARPLADLGLDVHLPCIPPAERCWSGAGVKRFLAGARPDPASTFRQIKGVIGRFMDFSRSLASQEVMCELVACYVIATYLLDGFNVAGYLWPNGDKGVGKTNLLVIVSELAYSGTLVLAGGSYASLRDLADYGATLAFDDAEGIMDRKADPDKRALLLAGNRRGTTVTVKELAADKTWITRHVNTFCFRLFSAIRLPDDVLASRTITVPLVRSADAEKANADPKDFAVWPYDRRALVDDLWAVGLTALSVMRQHEEAAVAKAELTGRDLQPWRALLAVAHWLEEEHQVGGIFDRLHKLSVDYQAERSELEAGEPTRVCIKALAMLVRDKGMDGREFLLEPAELASAMNVVAGEENLSKDGEQFTNAWRVGWLLKRLRFKRGPSGRNRQWQCSRAFAEGLGQAYRIKLDM